MSKWLFFVSRCIQREYRAAPTPAGGRSLPSMTAPGKMRSTSVDGDGVRGRRSQWETGKTHNDAVRAPGTSKPRREDIEK